MGTGRAAAAGRPVAGGSRRLSPVTMATGVTVFALGAAGLGIVTRPTRPPQVRAPEVDEARPSAIGGVRRPLPSVASPLIPPQPREASASAPEPAIPAMVMPPFGQPDEAQRYRDAKAAGSRRAVEILDQALLAANQDPRAGAVYLDTLRQRRAALLRATAPAPEAVSRPDEAPQDRNRGGR